METNFEKTSDFANFCFQCWIFGPMLCFKVLFDRRLVLEGLKQRGFKVEDRAEAWLEGGKCGKTWLVSIPGDTSLNSSLAFGFARIC